MGTPASLIAMPSPDVRAGAAPYRSAPPGGSGTTDWRAILRRTPGDLVLAHDLGLPDDPSSIYGRELLEARIDGSLKLTWWQAGQSGALSAKVSPAVVRRWAALLAEGNFPDFPSAELVGGASFRGFEARTNEHQARAVLSRFHFEDVPPYEELCAIADSVCAQMRGRKCWADPDPAKGQVRDVRPIGA
ncbi:hypothetical protein [Sorangium sp. So ce1024]|uniref:hypothetical protein n=1 Tax=unclassified Sorangium TaxID=2621164 RepID=UPI003EFF8F1B